MSCYYCGSVEHNDSPCYVRILDARRFKATSKFAHTRRVHCKVEQYDNYCGRPKQFQEWRFGNPFVKGKEGGGPEVIQKFQNWLETGENYENHNATEARRQWILSNVYKLKNKINACWCHINKPCHVDYLIELAEKSE